MTAQVSERLFYEGQTVALLSQPLWPYLQEQGQGLTFRMTNTANWRGYVGSWEIADDRLVLVGLKGRLENGTEASLKTLFPTATDRVFASWYSGKLRVPEGKLAEYKHIGFASRYEREILLEIRDGILVGTSTQSNEVDFESGGEFRRVSPDVQKDLPTIVTRLLNLWWR